MSKHTPGPWAVFSQNGVVFVHTDKGKKDVVHWSGFDCCDFELLSEQEANARLIAASPELLASLSAMLTYFGMDEDEWSKPVMDKARAAIRKATGEA